MYFRAVIMYNIHLYNNICLICARSLAHYSTILEQCLFTISKNFRNVCTWGTKHFLYEHKKIILTDGRI